MRESLVSTIDIRGHIDPEKILFPVPSTRLRLHGVHFRCLALCDQGKDIFLPAPALVVENILIPYLIAFDKSQMAVAQNQCGAVPSILGPDISPARTPVVFCLQICPALQPAPK